MLELDDINGYYGTSHVLHNLSLQIYNGQIVSLLGRNGAGKSTTLKSIMGLLTLQSGKVIFKEEDITSLEPYKRSRKGITLIPEGRDLFTDLTVRENLRMGSLGHENELDEMENIIYDIFPQLKERESQKAGTMSGGEQQMLSISRAIISDPELTLIDEPTEGLMPSLVDKLKTSFLTLNERGTTILLVAQNPELALEISDYIYVIDEGEILVQGGSKKLTNNRKLIEKYLMI